MDRIGKVDINLNQAIITLFCGYAFSMPFELVLEYLLQIDTILKPFRVFSLLIIGLFVLKVIRTGLYFDKQEKWDLLLYGIFLYGIIVSLIRMITRIFNMGLFVNDLFQSGLHVTTFFVFKATEISKKEGMKIFRFFMTGISINALYIYYVFMRNMQWGRQSGFTDNPNYAGFGIVAVLIFIALKTNFIRNVPRLVKYGILGLFLVSTFSVTGSRTGFVMLLIASVLVFFFSSIQRKIFLTLFGSLIVLILIPQQLKDVPMRGPTILFKRLNRSVNTDEEDVRFVIWRGVFRMLEDKGYGGMGIGQFKANFSQYYGQESNKLVLEIVNRNYYLSPHSDYLALLADYGLIGVSLYIIFLSVNLWKLFLRITYPSEDDDDRLLEQFSFAFFVCIIIFGLTAENFQHQLYWFLLMFTTKTFSNYSKSPDSSYSKSPNSSYSKSPDLE